MYCPNCGNNLTPDCNFCGNCGSQIIKDDKEKSNNKKNIITGFVVGLLLFFFVLFISYRKTHNAYFISVNPTTSSSIESSSRRLYR